MKKIVFLYGKKNFSISLIIFLNIASFFVQTASAGDIIDYEPKSYNIFFTRGDFFAGPFILVENKIDEEVWIPFVEGFGKGGQIGEFDYEFYLAPYDSKIGRIIYDSRDEGNSHTDLYSRNPPGRHETGTSLHYSVYTTNPDKQESGTIYIPITYTILPDKIKGPLYIEIITPASFDVTVYEGGSAHSALKIKGLPSEKLGLAFEPLPYGNGGKTYFGNGGVTRWADSPDGYYRLDEGQETEIRIYYYTSDQITGKITPPGEYDFVFRLYYWTKPDEYLPGDENQDYGIIEIPYHLKVLPAPVNAPEFPLNPVYAGGLIILGVFSILILINKK